jgi:phosphoglucomutase
MTVHELAGKPAPRSLLVNILRLMSAYPTQEPDVSDPTQWVVNNDGESEGGCRKS